MKNTGQFLIAALVAIVVAFAVTSYRTSTSSAHQESVYERVQRTHVLRCGYNLEPPSLAVDANTGKLYGISADIVEHAAALQGWKVEWAEQVGWSELTAGLIANRYDLVCVGNWVNAAQTRGSEFTMPIFYTAVHAYGRVDETRFDGALSNLNSSDYKIATIDGEFNDYTAREKFPNAGRVELPALTDPATLIMNITTRKADVVFLAAAEAEDYMRKNPGTLKRLSDKPVVVFDTALRFKAGEAAFAGVLNAALRQMHSDGFIETTLQKYEASPDAYLRLAKPYVLP